MDFGAKCCYQHGFKKIYCVPTGISVGVDSNTSENAILCAYLTSKSNTSN